MSSDRMTANAAVSAVATVAAAQRPRVAPVTWTAPATPAGNTAAVKPSPEVIKEVAERIESYLRSVGRSLEFRVDAASGRTVLSVRDAQTGELIRQIPDEEVLRLAEMAEDQTIVLVNERA